MVIITEQVQNAVNDQARQFLAQTNFIASSIILRNRHTNGKRGNAYAVRDDAEVEGDHIGCGGVLQIITMPGADLLYINKIHFDIDRCRCMFPPKLIQGFEHPFAFKLRQGQARNRGLDEPLEVQLWPRIRNRPWSRCGAAAVRWLGNSGGRWHGAPAAGFFPASHRF